MLLIISNFMPAMIQHYVIISKQIERLLKFMLITKQQDFENFLNEANNSSVVAIDTEFLRDKTY